MKTYNNLYSDIIAWPNIMEAWRKARRGKRYTHAAASFERNLDRELLSIQRDLLNQAYDPGPYRSFTIHEPKRRKISAAPFRDRIVHHALCNIIEPIYERRFIHDCYANRRRKGTHRAIDRCTYFLRRYRYVMHLDIQQFFPAIDHAVLKAILHRTITCPPTQALCDAIIDSGRGILSDAYAMHYFPGDDLLAADRPRNLPIGNLTSQFWANVYLHQLDHFAKHTLKARAFIRYVDDVLMFADDKETLNGWREDIIMFLHSLRLTIHTSRAQPRPAAEGVGFLGFIVYPTHRLLKRRKGIHYRRHLKALVTQYKRGEIRLEDVDASVQAWLGYVDHGDTWSLRQAIFDDCLLS